MKKRTLKDLEHEVRVLNAFDISNMCEAFRRLDECGSDRYMGSAVTITVKNINRDTPSVISEVAISDGLSLESIQALKRDLKRTYDLKMSFPHNKI